MPEGHTIHRQARDQTKDLAGHRIDTATVQERFADGAAQLDGRTLDRVEAYGKHLFQWWGPDVLHVHLGLFGRWRRRRSPPPDPVGEMRLRLIGPERTWDLSGAITSAIIDPDERDAVVAGLGPDPLRRDGDRERMWAKLHRSRRTVGALLMDQAVVAGIGNVYRAELLFLLGINPVRPGTKVTRGEFDALWDEMVAQLRLGVRRNRIVTRRADELPRSATKSSREDALYVYKRTECRWCGSQLAVAPMAGRRIWWCPVHQPA